MPSFDTVLEPNLVEVRNAIDQASKEIGTRFDFKGSSAAVELKDKDITVFGDSDFQLGQVKDVLNAKLRQVVEAGARKLLVNLVSLQQIDSSGISTIVRSYVTLGRRGGSLKLLNPTGRVREVLEVTHLLGAIPSYDNESNAISSFR